MLIENRIKYANKIHGLLSDHGITEEVKPLSVEGARVHAGTLAPDTVGRVLESYLDVIETLTEEIQELEEMIEERAGL